MELMPILSTLRRHKTAAALIVIEIALTATIVCNALHLIANRLEVLNKPSGLPENELVVLAVRSTGGNADAEALTREDLAALKALPGVKSVALTNQLVFGGNSNSSGVAMDAERRTRELSASNYAVGPGSVATMGLKLVAGRDFRPEEYQPLSVVNNDNHVVGQVIINQAMAEKLFPGQSAVGRSFYVYGEAPSTIVGVVETLPPPTPGRARRDTGYAMMFPLQPNFRGGSYMIRVDPAQREALLKAATAAVERIDPSRIVTGARTLEEMRAAYYAQDRAMVGLLGGVCAALLIVTAFGIVGLVSFWVQQRTRMIGTRRALGATRGQILRYFQAENFLLATAGIVLGLFGAMALSLLLMKGYAMPRLPWFYLPAGALVLWLLGQVAVLAPARRAAALPPTAALRS
jgi:putative ABC transport system permease protein